MEYIAYLSLIFSIITWYVVFYYQRRKSQREMYISLIDRFDTIIINFLESTLYLNEIVIQINKKTINKVDNLKSTSISTITAQRKASSLCDVIEINVQTNAEERKFLEESKKEFFEYSGILEGIIAGKYDDVNSVLKKLDKSADKMKKIRKMLLEKHKKEFSSKWKRVRKILRLRMKDQAIA